MAGGARPQLNSLLDLDGIELANLDPCIIGGDLPVDASISRVSMFLPRSDIRPEGRCVIGAPVERSSASTWGF